MAIKHNQQIQKNHFHKDWYVARPLALRFLDCEHPRRAPIYR
jgi:hypothetical protein